MNEQERIVQGARIEIQDRDGWHKTFVIQKAITHVGSEARNDIVLETWRGMGVSSRHVQIISMGAAYRVVNIGDREIVVAPDPNSAGTPIAPLATAELRDGALIQIGDFRLRLFMPTGSAAGCWVSVGRTGRSCHKRCARRSDISCPGTGAAAIHGTRHRPALAVERGRPFPSSSLAGRPGGAQPRPAGGRAISAGGHRP